MSFPIVALAVLTLGMSAAAASARPHTPLKSLPLIIEDASAPGGMRRIGSLSRYLHALRRAKQVCDYSTYAYGANLSCRTTTGKMVHIGITAVPTHGPEFANVQDIRPDGVNSAYLAKSEFAAFLADLIRRKPAK